MKKTISIIFAGCSLFSYAQLPNTDVWLLDIKEKNGVFIFTNPVNATNREGYDNQPEFSPDSKYILYSSVHEDKQADIYKYDIASKTVSRVTNSPESEYSPTFMPGGKRISSVLVEKDSAQRLWCFSLDGKDPQLVTSNVDSVGYHCWINKDSVVLFILTNPFTLQSVNIKEQRPVIIASNIGRSIHEQKESVLFTQEDRVPPSALAVGQDSVKRWVCSVDGKGKISRLVVCPKGSEDFALLKDGTIMTANINKLLKFEPNKDKDWKEIADLSSFGITKITRIAISPDQKKIAVVDNK